MPTSGQEPPQNVYTWYRLYTLTEAAPRRQTQVHQVIDPQGNLQALGYPAARSFTLLRSTWRSSS